MFQACDINLWFRKYQWTFIPEIWVHINDMLLDSSYLSKTVNQLEFQNNETYVLVQIITFLDY